MNKLGNWKGGLLLEKYPWWKLVSFLVSTFWSLFERKSQKLDDFFKEIQPDIVINCSGIVGNSVYNSVMNNYDIFSKNISMQINILDCCEKYKVQKIIFLSN